MNQFVPTAISAACKDVLATWKNPRLSFMALSCVAFMATHANATVNLLTSGSFELGGFVNQGSETMSLSAGNTAVTDWTVVGSSLAWINTGNPWGLSAQNGNFFLDLTTAGAPFSGVTQTISTVVGAQDDLTFELGTDTAAWGGPPVSILASARGTSQPCCSPSLPSSNSATEKNAKSLFPLFRPKNPRQPCVRSRTKQSPRVSAPL